MTHQPWDLQVDLDEAAFDVLDREPVLTDHLADVCRELGADAGTATAAAPSVAALVTVRVDRVAAMGAEPDGGISWAIEADGIAPEWAVRDGVLDLLLHISQPAVRAGDLFLVQIATQDGDGGETSSARRLVLVRRSGGELQAQLSYRPVPAEVLIAKVLSGPLSRDDLTDEQAALLEPSVAESLGPNALAWYEWLAAQPGRE